MKLDWDRNNHKGKLRKNIETSYRILFGFIVIGCLVLTWGLVYKLIKMIF